MGPGARYAPYAHILSYQGFLPEQGWHLFAARVGQRLFSSKSDNQSDCLRTICCCTFGIICNGGVFMSYFFDEHYYIAAKLAHMDSIGQPMTEVQLKSAFSKAGYTAQEHYEAYGRDEGLNPNAYFNEYEYLEAKAKQLNSVGNQPNPAGGAWDADAVLKAITDAGMTPADHYERYGAFETDADGNFINPSNAFDANAYWSAKLFELHTEYPDENWTMETMLRAFRDADVSPVSHYLLWGADETDASGIAFVQTVPISQRVPNDPARDAVTGYIVPGNYMGATPAPGDGNAAAAQNPCDVGGLADPSVSPLPVYPESSLPTPGEAGYRLLPSTIKPAPGVVILPPTEPSATVKGNWLVVDVTTGEAIVIGRDGSIIGKVDVNVTDNGGGMGVNVPDNVNVPVSTLPPLDPSDLPPWIVPDPDLPNNFPLPPPQDHSGITATAAGDDITLGGTIHSSGVSKLILADDGSLHDWSGQKDGMALPSFTLGTDGVLDASGVTGRGTLYLDTSAAESLPHSVKGALHADNVAFLAPKMAYTGGEANDTVTVTGKGDNAVASSGGIDLGNGENSLTMDDSKAMSVTGGSGADTVTLTQTEVSGDINLGDGNNSLTVSGKDSRLVNVTTGSGDDIVTINDGATVNGTTVNGSIALGAGRDTLVFTGGAPGGCNIEMGAGVDSVRFESLDEGRFIQNRGDSGNYSEAIAGLTNQVDTSELDVFEGTSWAGAYVKIFRYTPVNSDEGYALPSKIERDSLYIVRGEYTPETARFTPGAGGNNDRLMIYGFEPGTSVDDFEAIVLVGVDDCNMSNGSAGVKFYT